MVDKSSLVCGNNSCLGGAGQIITKGLAGQGCNLLVGFFHLQIKIQPPQPPRTDTGIPVNSDYSSIDSDPNIADVYTTVRWPFSDKRIRRQFKVDRSLANVVVNKINQINSFNESFSTMVSDFRGEFTSSFQNIKNKFKTKWKK